MESISNYLFTIALFLNAAFFVPQLIKLLTSKNAENISFITFAGFSFIQFAIILHAYYISDWLLFFGYALSFIPCGSITLLIMYYRIVSNRGMKQP